jgi:hypothetical protein
MDALIHALSEKYDSACRVVGESQFGRLERKLSTLSTLWLVQTEKKFFKDLFAYLDEVSFYTAYALPT